MLICRATGQLWPPVLGVQFGIHTSEHVDDRLSGLLRFAQVCLSVGFCWAEM